jgi:hypothetical protein
LARTFLAALTLALALAFAGAPAHAVVNPFYAAYQNEITVTDVRVTYADGSVERAPDRAARNFVERSFPAELRAEFESASAAGVTDDSYGERLSEFLVARSVRAETAQLTGARRVRLEINVTEARIPGMGLGAAMFAASNFPRLAGNVSILDAETGAVLATTDIRNVRSFSGDNDSAAQTHGFRYNFSGTDTGFRILAGTTEAFSRAVATVLLAPEFANPDEERVVLAAPRITAYPPNYTVTLTPPEQ